MALTFTDENVEQIIESGKPVMVDFWATWCGPCVAMGPMVDKLAEEYEGRVEIGKYNTDDGNDFCMANRVMSVPTFIFFKDGKAVARLALSTAPWRRTLRRTERGNRARQARRTP